MPNTKLYISLLTLALFCSPLPAAQATKRQHNILNNGYVKQGLIVTGLFAALWLTAPEDIQEKLTEQLEPGYLAKNFLKELSAQAFTTLCHELGHASTAQLFTGVPSKIYLGSHYSPENSNYCNIGNLSVNGFNPKQGTTLFCMPGSTLEKSIVFLAGGASGLIGHQLYKFVLTYLSDDSPERNTALLKAYDEGKKLDHISLSQLFEALLPVAPNSDASQFWRDCVGIDEHLVAVIIRLSPLIMILICDWYYHHNSNASLTHNEIPLHTQLLQFILNWYLSGYVRFEIEPCEY